MTGLDEALEAAAHALEGSGITWMLVGSMATRLHGVAGIIPGDVDVLVHPDTHDGPLWEVARRFTAAWCDDQPPGTSGDDDLATFRSSMSTPLLATGPWTFGRWWAAGAKLEVARLREGLEGGLVETMGREVWEHRRLLRWHGRLVPAVALEVQWATIAARGQNDRMAAIAAACPPWDVGLARRALAGRGLDPADTLLSPIRAG